MYNKRLVYALIGILAIGFYLLPSTLSMFAGQHSWVKPQNIKCEKCHWLEYEEITCTPYSLHSPHRTVDKVFECIECHNVSMNLSYYATGQRGEHSPAHAATTVSCLVCHGDLFSNGTACWTTCHTDTFPSNEVNTMHELAKKYGMGHNLNECEKCHRDAPWEVQTNVTAMRANVFIEHVDDELTHPQEAHRAFFLGMSGENTTRSESGLSGSNEACLACHSMVKVNISWKRLEYIGYDINFNASGYIVKINDSSTGGSNISFTSST